MPITVTPRAGYKIYAALLTQSGTDAPAATVIQNTLGGEVVWSYQGIGIYFATLSGAFTVNKVPGFTAPLDYTFLPSYTIAPNGDSPPNNLVLQTNYAGTPTDELLNNVFIEIRVYP